MSLFNIQNKYNEDGVYRFMNDQAECIYIGKAKKIHDRLFKQHFSNSGSNVDKKAYKETAKLEIIKLPDPSIAVGLELYLIDKYRPRYNKQDKRKDLSMLDYQLKDYYESIEKWQTYYTFREYDFNKIKVTKFQNRLAIAITYIFFITLLGYMFNNLL